MHESLFVEIRSCKSACEVWEKLEKTYEDRGINRECALFSQFTDTKMIDCQDMQAYINTIMEAVEKMAEIGQAPSKRQIGMKLLTGLPDEYIPLRLGIEASGIEITGDSVKAKLQESSVKLSNSSTQAVIKK